MDQSKLSTDSNRGKVKKSIWSKITYRVQLPSGYERKDLSQIIQTLFNVNAAEFKIHSLSLDISEVAGLSRNVATISFRVPPADLDDGQDWGFDIPTADEELYPGRIYFDTHFKGFTPLTPAENDSNCDINCIFLHGWGGHAIGSFIWPGTTYTWIRDDLHKRFQKLRIWTYGYGSKMNDVNSVSNAHDLGKGLAIDLRDFRRNAVDKQNPMIFVAHSLGGLLFQEVSNERAIMPAMTDLQLALLSMCKGRPDSDDQLSLQLIRGALFFGVPGQGMNVDALASMIEGLSNQYTSTLLNKDVGWHRRDDQEDAFSRIFPDSSLRLVQFYETRKTPEKAWNGERWIETDKFSLLVEPKSATSRRRVLDAEDDTIPLDKNHLDMVKFAENDVHDYRKVCNALVRLTSDAHTIIHERVQQQRLKEERILAEEVAPGDKEYLKSLAYDEMFDREHKVSQAEVATCTWLLSHPSYQQWLNDSCSIFWIKGKPGSGKSTLLRHAYNNAQEHAAENVVIASFFFHGRGSQLQKSLTGLYRSLLHQIIEKLPGIRKSLGRGAEPFSFDKAQDHDVSERQEQELADTFEKCLSKAAMARSLQIYVDALDECGVEAASKLIEIFRRVLGKSKLNHGTIKVCFSCRHYPEIAIDDGLDVIVEKQNAADIQQYVNTQLARLKGYISDENLLHRFVERSNGIFQWTVFVVSQILSSSKFGFDAKTVEQKINGLPSDLYKLYESVLKMESSYDRQRSLLLFQWTVLAQDPLTVEDALPIIFDREEFEPRFMFLIPEKRKSVFGVRVDEENIHIHPKIESQIRNLSKGLIEIVKGFSSQTLQVIHHSVKDYLLNGGFCFLGASLSTKEYSHFMLSQVCLEYLNMQEIRKELLGEFPSNNDSLLEHAMELSSIKYAACFDTIPDDPTDIIPPSYSRHAFGHKYVTPLRFELPGRLSIKWQGMFSSEHIPNPTKPIFVDWGENGQITISHIHVAYTLIRSSNKKISNITKLKLKIWVFYRFACRFPFFHLVVTQWVYHAKLAQACCPEQYDWKNFNVLLDRAAEVLSIPIATDYFFEQERDYKEEEEEGGEAEGALGFLKLAPFHKEDIDLMRQSLHLATVNGLYNSTLWLCKENSAINAKDYYGQTPLHLAISRGHKDIADVLLKTEGVDIFTSNDAGDTLLHAAVVGKLPSVLSDLLIRGLPTDKRDGKSRTPLHRAARRKDVASLTILLNAGADIAARDSRDQTPLERMMNVHNWSRPDSIASTWQPSDNIDLRDSLRLLTARGADTQGFRNPKKIGNSWLKSAVEHLFFDIAELLLKCGVRIDEEDESGATPLLQFLQFLEQRPSANLFANLEFLLLHGADIHRTLPDGSSVLLLAAQIYDIQKSKEIMLFLLEHGADPNVRNNYGATVLYTIARKIFRKFDPFPWTDKKELLALLIAHGADVTARDTSHDVWLLAKDDVNDQLAGSSSQKEVFSLAVSQAKDFFVDTEIMQLGLKEDQFVITEDTDTARIYLDIITLFLDAGAIVNPDESKYQDLFQVARRHARIDLVERITKQSEIERSKLALIPNAEPPSVDLTEAVTSTATELDPVPSDTRKRWREIEFDELTNQDRLSKHRRRRSM